MTNTESQGAGEWEEERQEWLRSYEGLRTLLGLDTYHNPTDIVRRVVERDAQQARELSSLRETVKAVTILCNKLLEVRWWSIRSVQVDEGSSEFFDGIEAELSALTSPEEVK